MLELSIEVREIKKQKKNSDANARTDSIVKMSNNDKTFRISVLGVKKDNNNSDEESMIGSEGGGEDF